MYYGDFLKVRLLALPSRMALIIRVWLYYEVFSKSSEFVGVRSAAEVGFVYRGLACITELVWDYSGQGQSLLNFNLHFN